MIPPGCTVISDTTPELLTLRIPPAWTRISVYPPEVTPILTPGRITVVVPLERGRTYCSCGTSLSAGGNPSLPEAVSEGFSLICGTYCTAPSAINNSSVIKHLIFSSVKLLYSHTIHHENTFIKQCKEKINHNNGRGSPTAAASWAAALRNSTAETARRLWASTSAAWASFRRGSVSRPLQ